MISESERGLDTVRFPSQLRQAPMNDVTLMLRKIGSDDKLLAEQPLPLVYEELRELAAGRMSR